MHMPRIHVTRRFLRITAGIISFILLLLVLAAWQVPQFTRRALTRDVAALLGREVQAGKISFNPFTLTLRVHDLAVKQPNSTQPLLSIAGIQASAAWSSIFWLAPVVDALVIQDLNLALVREGPLKFNFSDISQRMAERAMPASAPVTPEKKSGLLRFSLNNIRLENSSVTLDDQVTHRQQRIDEISLGIPFVSNFGYATHIDVLPQFHARINGSPFDLHGTARPFDQVPSSTLDVVFEGLALDKWADAWAVPLPIKLKQALLDSNLQIIFEQPKDGNARLHVSGGVRLRELDLRQPSGESLLAWQALTVSGLDVLPLERKLSVADVTWFDPVIQVRREANQQFNWDNVLQDFQRLLTQVSAAKGRAAQPRGNREQLAAKGIVEPLQNNREKSAAKGAMGQPQSDSENPAVKRVTEPEPSQHNSEKPTTKSTIAQQQGNIETLAAQETVAQSWRATRENVSPKKVVAQPWRVHIEKIGVQNGQLHVRDPGVNLNYGLARLALTIQQVQWPQSKDAPITMQLSAANSDGANLHVKGGGLIQPIALNMDMQANRFPLVPFAGVVRSKAPVTLLDGTVSVASKLAMQEVKGVKIGQASDFNVALSQVSVRDESLKTPVVLGLKTLALGVDKLALGPNVSKFNLQGSGLLGEGSLASQGSFTLQPLTAQAQIDLENLNVAVLAPYVATRLNATLRSAKLNVKGKTAFVAAREHVPMKASWQGEIDTRNLNLKDSVNQVDFLVWKQLRLRAMDIALVGKQPTINLGDILLDDFYGNILLNQKGRLNVLDLVIAPGQTKGSITQDPHVDAQNTSSRTKPVTASRTPLPPITVRSITLKRGRTTFTDHFIKPRYRAELSGITGSVSAVSSEAPDPANVKLTAQLHRTAPLLLNGIVNPFDRFLNLDIKASAEGVDLLRFTPYSTKYVGYPLTHGKLSLEVAYRIKNRILEASNHVQLNQLEFGEKVPSPTATKLPVMLAVALLKDRHNNIDVNLPVSGSLNDPHFSVGGVIWEVVSNFIVKAVTSPFSLLASAFGGGEELSFVQFEPGSATLNQVALDKLKKLTTALTERPALKMDILGYVDPVSDEAGLRQAWVEAQIRAAQANDTGKSVESLQAEHAPLSATDRAKYLEDAYDDTPIENKPRNFLGIAKSLPPDQMEALMRQAAPVGEAQLHQLAKERAVAAYLQFQQNHAPIDRIFLVPPSVSVDQGKDSKTAKEKGGLNRVEFSLKR